MWITILINLQFTYLYSIFIHKSNMCIALRHWQEMPFIIKSWFYMKKYDTWHNICGEPKGSPT